jgi:predicted O-linked N-acetylglucosamine transferase (SPINDLY family)
MQTDRPVLGSFCQVSKISSTTLAIWSQLLQYIPEALLVLKDRGLQDPTVRERLEQALVNAGIDRDRIRFMAPVSTWHDHVDHYNIMDIALDTTPWSSATTAFEALAMGVPLLAIRGECMAARMSSSLIKGLGEEWTISNEQSLTQKTKKILKNLYNVVENRKLKQERQHRAIFSNLFDGKDLSDKLVDCFREISL